MKVHLFLTQTTINMFVMQDEIISLPQVSMDSPDGVTRPLRVVGVVGIVCLVIVVLSGWYT